MKFLKDILIGFDFELIQGSIEEKKVASLDFDSRQVSNNSVF